MTDLSDRPLDVVVFGATGDTGCLGCCWLQYHGKQIGIQAWAPAARNHDKLKKDVLDRLQAPGEQGLMYSTPIKADSSNYESVVAMCKMTKVVLACAGPYEKFGEAVVQACCEVGTHYVDVTGETPWVAQMENQYGEQALAKGITLISCAGYDSVPPDLSTYLAAKTLEKTGDKLARFDLICNPGGGAMPTGTVETMLLAVQAFRSKVYGCLTCGLCGGGGAKPDNNDVELAKPLRIENFKPYVPKSEKENLATNSKWNMWPSYSSLAGQWTILHIMAPVNINVVHRTAAEEGYGGLVYRERQHLGNGCCSLYGFLPMLLILVIMSNFVWIILMPCGLCCLNAMLKNADAVEVVRKKMFDFCSPTGKINIKGYGISKSGKTRIQTNFFTKYEAGLGFTMLSSSAIAGLVVQRALSDTKPRPGFQTAVRSLSGEAVMEGLKNLGVDVDVSVETK